MNATPADARRSPVRLSRRVRWGWARRWSGRWFRWAADVVPRNRLVDSRQTASQLREEVLTAQAERDSLAAQYETAAALAERERAARLAAAQERDALVANVQETEHLAARLQAGLDIANRRLENLSDERGELQGRYIGLLRDVGSGDSPLSGSATARFEELAARYPDFDFDPLTGVSKFGPHVLFDSGKADLNPGAIPLLREFAEIMASPEARDLNVLIVGHTDDERIAGARTREKHPTNWHLSTNRANEVAVTLAAAGLAESRMGVAGYSKFQPAVRNRDDANRAMNRRVEIYVLAPEVKVAGRCSRRGCEGVGRSSKTKKSRTKTDRHAPRLVLDFLVLEFRRLKRRRAGTRSPRQSSSPPSAASRGGRRPAPRRCTAAGRAPSPPAADSPPAAVGVRRRFAGGSAPRSASVVRPGRSVPGSRCTVRRRPRTARTAPRPAGGRARRGPSPAPACEAG